MMLIILVMQIEITVGNNIFFIIKQYYYYLKKDNNEKKDHKEKQQQRQIIFENRGKRGKIKVSIPASSPSSGRRCKHSGLPLHARNARCGGGGRRMAKHSQGLRFCLLYTSVRTPTRAGVSAILGFCGIAWFVSFLCLFACLF